MEIIIGSIITIGLIILGLIFKSSRILFFLQFVWVLLIVSFNSGGMDYEGNEAIYLASSYFPTSLNSIFSNLLGYYSNSFGWDYQEYNLFVFGFSLLLLFYLIINKTSQPATYGSLFLLFPFVSFVVQKRFFLASIYLLMSYILWGDKKYKKSVLSLIIATGLHFSIIFSLPVFILDTLKKYRVFFAFIVLIVESYFVLFNRDLFISLAGDKGTVYINSNISFMAAVLFIIFQIMFILLYLYIRQRKEGKSKKWEYFDNRLQIYSLVFAPFLFFDATFFRYYEVVMLYSYIFIARSLYGSISRNTITYYLSFGYLVLIGLFQFATIYFNSGNGWDDFLTTLFEYNTFLR